MRLFYSTLHPAKAVKYIHDGIRQKYEKIKQNKEELELHVKPAFC